MQNKLKAKLILVIAIIAAFACCGVTFAWFSGSSEIDVDINSAILTNYFERGSGTAEDPFIIHTPRHLYNLAWLQYMGQFNKADGDGNIRQFYFELCNDKDDECIIDDGTGITELDMDGWVLPPIGTPQNPFVGNFNGNGITISNLTVSGNHSDLSNVADNETNFANSSYVNSNQGCDIVGLFGVIGNPDGTAGTLDGHTYTSAYNEVKNVNVENITVKTQTDTSLIGIVAGYVNGNVSGVGVIDSAVVASDTAAISGITSNISDYSTIGYCTEPFVGQLDSVKISIAQPTLEVRQKTSSEDDGNQWGGSISMKDLYERLDDMKSTATAISIDTVTTERHILNEDGTETVLDVDVESDSVNSNYVHYSSERGGSATFYTNTQDQYKCLYSGKKINSYKKRIEYYTSEIVSKGAFTISALDNQYFMFIEIEDGYFIESLTSQVNASKWTFVNELGEIQEDATEGYLRTRIGDVDYYLIRNGNSLGISTSNDTYWTYEDSNLFCSDSTSNYYLSNDNGLWTLESEAISHNHVITDGNGNYLTVTYSGQNGRTATLGNTKNVNDAAEWDIRTTSGGKVNISTVHGEDIYYLNYNDGWFSSSLTIQRYRGVGTGTSATAWDCEIDSADPSKYYVNYDGDYITYRNNNWTISDSTTRVTYYRFGAGSNYMYIDENGNLGVTTSSNQATLWRNNGNDYYAEVGGETWYLCSSLNADGGIVTVKKSNELTSYHTWSFRSNSYLRYGTSDREYVYYDSSAHQWKLLNRASNPVTYSEIQKTVYPSFHYIVEEPVAHAEINKVETVDNLPEYTYVTHVEEDIDVYTPYTYVPLCSDDTEPFGVKSANTGYMVSGTYNTLSGQSANGDIRVSWFAMSNLNHALGQDRYDKNKLQIITRTYKSNGLKRITDSYNKNSTASTYLNGYSAMSVEALGLEKYNNSRDQLETIIQQDTSRIYGLHFMDASISMDHIITVPYALINGTEYTDYELPEDCIDCILPQKGFINFFAGSYYASDGSSFHNNDSFFSLNQIIRDSDKHITGIKTIKHIYADPNNETLPFMYQYSDGKYSTNGVTILNSKPSNYSQEIFDCAWIETPFERTNSNLMYSMFYYEVPVNPGEYALGSVSGRAGAYIPYLDISTNAIQYRIEKLTETFSIKEESYSYPKGIQLIESTSSAIVDGNRVIDDKDSAAVAISGVTGNSGMNISRDGDVITVTEQSGQAASYVGNTVQLKNSGGDALSSQPLHTTEVAVKRITENSHNNSENIDTDTITEITVVTIDNEVVSRNEVIRTVVSQGGVITSDTTTGGITTGGIDSFSPVIACQYISEDGAYTTNITNNRTRVPAGSYESYGAQLGEGWKTVSDYINYISAYNITINNQEAITVVPTTISGGFSGNVNGQSMTEWTKIELSAQ